ncbi:MAG: hypothetical protein N2045_10120 [Fimbriimonadales bacterium]|nr:hypothetical protein [Fimbriimonadales bacterium]
MQQWKRLPFGYREQPDGSIAVRGIGAPLLWRDSSSEAGAFSAVFTLHRATTSQWKTAGLTLWRNERNHWRLNLVEAPDHTDRRHFVELQQMYGGQWLSQEGVVPDESLAYTREGWQWNYETPYRLRIEWDNQKIVGEVWAGDTLCWRGGWRFREGIYWGEMGIVVNGFQATIRDARIERMKPFTPSVVILKPPPVRARVKPARQRATGFFRVEQVEGVWWFIDPSGNLFLALGTDHASYFVHWCEALGYAPYHRNMERRHGSEARWAEETLQRLKAWGFTALGVNHSIYLRHKGLPHPEQILGMGQGFAYHDDLVKPIHWTGFPNVFSPEWESWCDWVAYERCRPNRDDPWLLGYMLDNELEWFGKDYLPWGLAVEALRRPAGHTARVALADLLRQRYKGDIAAFNRAWEANLRDFREIAESETPPAIRTPRAQQDGIAFVRLAARRYFETATRAIRKHDPNHLILGCRFAGDAPPIWDIAGEYCDVISVNTYPRIDLRQGRVLDWEERLRQWHKESKRPLMITEWSFPALDSGLPCKHGAGMRVDTQSQRARCFRIFQETALSLPFVVGSNFFMWVDEPAQGVSRTFPEDSNYGLVNEQGVPYRELVATATEVHRRAYEIHAASRRFWERSPQPTETRPVLTAKAQIGADSMRLPFVVRNRGEQAFTGWVCVDLPPNNPASRWKGAFACRTREGKPVRFTVEPLYRERAWVYLQNLRPGEQREYTLSFAAERPRTARPQQYYRLAPDAQIGSQHLPLQLRFSAERAPIGELRWQGEPYGRYTVVLWQVRSENRWLAPNQHALGFVQVEDIEYGRGWLFHQPEPDAPDIPFAVEWEFMLVNGLMLVRYFTLQNRGKQPMEVKGIYHYPLSLLGGSDGDDEAGGVPNYYLNAGVWEDRAANRFYGAIPLNPLAWRCSFFKDEQGRQHPDLWVPLAMTIPAGESRALPGGWVALVWGRGRFGETEWRMRSQQVQAYGGLEVAVALP